MYSPTHARNKSSISQTINNLKSCREQYIVIFCIQFLIFQFKKEIDYRPKKELVLAPFVNLVWFLRREEARDCGLLLPKHRQGDACWAPQVYNWREYSTAGYSSWVERSKRADTHGTLTHSIRLPTNRH